MRWTALALVLLVACGSDDDPAAHQAIDDNMYHLVIASVFWDYEGKRYAENIAVGGTFELTTLWEGSGTYLFTLTGGRYLGKPFSCEERQVKVTLNNEGEMIGASVITDKCTAPDDYERLLAASMVSVGYNYYQTDLGDLYEECHATYRLMVDGELIDVPAIYQYVYQPTQS